MKSIFLLLLPAIVLCSCHTQKQEDESAHAVTLKGDVIHIGSESPVLSKLTKEMVKQEPYRMEFTTSGVVQAIPSNYAEVASPVSGRITKSFVRLGQKVDILKINTCPLCGGKHLGHAITCTDHYASGEQFNLVRCDDCGFIFTQGAPVEAEIGRYYETPDYISHTDTRKGLMNRVYHEVRKYMLSRKAKLIKRTSGLSKGTLLDIGTGTGYFSNAMKERGWRVKAIEKSPQARSFAKEHFELDVDTEDALAGYADHSFDAITLWHVMEHLEHLNETWEKLFKLLKERGVLIVAVPNPSSYDAEKYKEWWAAYDVPRHLWHFTPSVMQQFGVKHGFKLAEQHPMPFDAFYVSMLTERYKGSRLSFLKGMWTGLLAWFSSLAKKERSSSMIYVFRKK